VTVGIVIYYFGRRLKSPVLAMPSGPETLELKVDRKGIAVGSDFYPLADIAELSYQAPGVPAQSSTVAFAGSGAVGLGVAFGAAATQSAMNVGHVIAAERASRSFHVLLRKRSHSVPVSIANGLTEQTAQALVNDLARALGWK
jgi:hypothetical protein